jgi:hypothetical protein
VKSIHGCAISLSLLLALLFTGGIGADDSLIKVYVKEVGVFLVLPKDYSLQRSDEPNRRGSFASYNFSGMDDPNSPTLQEIRFFSKKSIKRFEDECAKNKDSGGESFCETGEYPTIREYVRQKKALQNPQDHKTKYQLKRFGNRDFIVSNHPCIGGTGFYREYRTFLNVTMVAVWIYMENVSQAKAADNLFAGLKIMKQEQRTSGP